MIKPSFCFICLSEMKKWHEEKKTTQRILYVRQTLNSNWLIINFFYFSTKSTPHKLLERLSVEYKFLFKSVVLLLSVDEYTCDSTSHCTF